MIATRTQIMTYNKPAMYAYLHLVNFHLWLIANFILFMPLVISNDVFTCMAMPAMNLAIAILRFGTSYSTLDIFSTISLFKMKRQKQIWNKKTAIVCVNKFSMSFF